MSNQFPTLNTTERGTMTPLLEKRIKEFDIALPRTRPAFDRVFVYPLAGKTNDETFEGTSIIKPKVSRDKLDAARGVLVKAGLKALEHLWSHGFELGHIVLFARFSPWQYRYERAKRMHDVVIVRTSELVGSEDLEEDVISGDMRLNVSEDGVVCWEDRPRVDPEENDEL